MPEVAWKLTPDPLIALELLMRSWCRNAAVVVAVHNSSTNAVRIGRESEVCNGNAAVTNSELTICKLMNDSKIMTLDPDPEGDAVRLGTATGDCRYTLASSNAYRNPKAMSLPYVGMEYHRTTHG